MNINLAQENVFEENVINFDKKINIVFGKNGTGKSTIAKLIKEQVSDYDIRIFQGFEGIIDANKKLNAVVLGEENTLINTQIEAKQTVIEELGNQKNTIIKSISRPQVDSEENFWTKCESANKTFTNKENEIKDFKTQSAASIKNETSPQISAPTYNLRNFSAEIENARLLQETEILQYTNILKSEAKNAEKIKLPIIDHSGYLNDVNEILVDKVTEKVIISRLENNENKRKFAEDGLACHQKGDVCAFCGNIIEDDTFAELESYFSADEVKKLQKNIQDSSNRINKEIFKLESVNIQSEQFYPEFLEKLKSIYDRLREKLDLYKNFFHQLSEALQNKQSNLFMESNILHLEIPPMLNELQKECDELVEENNQNDLLVKQKDAQDKLRYHKIKTLIDEYEYSVKMCELDCLEKEKNRTKLELEKERNKIYGESGLDYQISKIQTEIDDLRAQTKDEKKLAQIINTKLKHSVSFELVHYENEDGEGFYRVKCLRTNTTRDITQLSTGEKNIIAFLYFIEKLGEINENELLQNKKVIVFDDPMNSNDDTMQYIIIDELQKLMKSIRGNDKFILFTHNNHFYLNVKYGRKYNEDRFIRFVSNGCKTNFKVLVKEQEDFKTNYEALWSEVIYLFSDNSTSPELLLNPIRRIIETYTKFNGVNKNIFYENLSGAKKLFDVNSHSIDDLEADLNGKTKNDIILLMKQCFEDNNAIEHFNKHWPSV